MITPPIILDNRGDLTVWDSVQAAESYAEPIDVRNDEYIIYDGTGRILVGTIECDVRGERTRIIEPDYEAHAPDVLRQRLVRHLSTVKDLRTTDLGAKSLGELIELARHSI